MRAWTQLKMGIVEKIKVEKDTLERWLCGWMMEKKAKWIEHAWAESLTVSSRARLTKVFSHVDSLAQISPKYLL
jgi:hypothetical protein